MGRIDNSSILSALAGGPTASGELARLFGVTRQAIHHHMSRLRNEGLVRQTGKGRAARWELVHDAIFTWPLPPPEAVGEDVMWGEVKDRIDDLRNTSQSALTSLNYAVTEILNNAIDHSKGTIVSLSITVGHDVVVAVSDDGIGAFRDVREHFSLPDDRDAVAHIAKGRQTTAPSQHSGQGLFFTSKAVDIFQLEANGLIWKVDNRRDDVALGPSVVRQGTRVLLEIASHTTRSLKEVFDRFSEPDDLEFDRSALRVSLGDHSEEFMSRSEAKRIAMGLEEFANVDLDFRGVREVGQGFVDQLFRVWAREHPSTTLHVTGASPEVRFMIDRGLPRR